MARNVRTAPPRRSTRLAVAPEASAEDRRVIDGPEPAEEIGERCRPCKGYGLVRGIGRRAGAHYTSLSGAQAALEAGRAVDCPACGGLGAELVVSVAS